MEINQISKNFYWIVLQAIMCFVIANCEILSAREIILNNEFCKKVHLHDPQGVIRSPNYPLSYQNQTSCTWYIAADPDEVVTLSFSDLNIEEDSEACYKPPCCTANWVKIGHGHEQRHYCGQNAYPPPPISILGDVWIKFHTSHQVKGGRGFKLDYVVGTCPNGQLLCKSGTSCYSTYEHCNGHVDCLDYTDELGCGSCLANHTSCSFTSDVCFNPYTQRCNRILDCPNGEDEQSCEPGCEGKILCSSGVGCYSAEERCNGVAQCGDASDEKFCTPELCRSERGGFLCTNRHCIREIWCCDRTNDCGDGSDETNCLKNSVIAAAVIGSLVCGLLLVVAISCSCKLYALRSMTNNMVARETPLSQLEREFMYREPPPSYAVATGDAAINSLYPDMVYGGPNSETMNRGGGLSISGRGGGVGGARAPSRHHHGGGSSRRTRSHRHRSQTNNPPAPPRSSGALNNVGGNPMVIPQQQQFEIARRNSNNPGGINLCEVISGDSSMIDIAANQLSSRDPKKQNTRAATTPTTGGESSNSSNGSNGGSGTAVVPQPVVGTQEELALNASDIINNRIWKTESSLFVTDAIDCHNLSMVSSSSNSDLLPLLPS